MNTRKTMQWLKLPFILSMICLLLIQQFYPKLLKTKTGWLSYLFQHETHHLNPPASYHPILKKIAPSVVHIFTTKYAVDHKHIDSSPIPPKIQKSLGSGVIVNKKGYILTNYHVIKNSSNLLISLLDGRQTWAKIIGTDEETDLAVLKINLDDLLPAQLLYSKNEINIGDIVLAIGNPLGLDQTVSLGIISATKRHLRLNTYESFLQTDAAINLGNSGGAIINTNGKLIGIATALITSGGGNEGLGFAIPANIAQFVLQSILAHGKVIRGWLGIDTQSLTSELANTYGLPVNTGILITNIYANSPAEKAGLKRGYVILKINKNHINGEQSIMSYVATLRPGTKIKAVVLEDKNKLKKVVMTVAERPPIKQNIQ